MENCGMRESVEVRLAGGSQAPVPHPAVWIDDSWRGDHFRDW